MRISTQQGDDDVVGTAVVGDCTCVTQRIVLLLLLLLLLLTAPLVVDAVVVVVSVVRDFSQMAMLHRNCAGNISVGSSSWTTAESSSCGGSDDGGAFATGGVDSWSFPFLHFFLFFLFLPPFACEEEEDEAI